MCEEGTASALDDEEPSHIYEVSLRVANKLNNLEENSPAKEFDWHADE